LEVLPRYSFFPLNSPWKEKKKRHEVGKEGWFLGMPFGLVVLFYFIFEK
jgi:hypothetical protein